MEMTKIMIGGAAIVAVLAAMMFIALIYAADNAEWDAYCAAHGHPADLCPDNEETKQ